MTANRYGTKKKHTKTEEFMKKRLYAKKKTHTLNGSFGSLVRVILNVTLLPLLATGAFSAIFTEIVHLFKADHNRITTKALRREERMELQNKQV